MPEAVGPKHESPGRDGQHRGPSDTGPLTRNSWSMLWDLGPGPELPGTADRTRGPSDMGVSRPGELVDTVGTQTQE